jgi:hypothetical protein
MKTTTVTVTVGIFLTAIAVGLYIANRPEPEQLTLASPCDGNSTDRHCAPMVGCIAGSDTVFTGRADGYFKGRIVGQLSTGAICSGTWGANATQSGGSGHATCDDTTEFTVRFHSYNRDKWVVVGKGETKANQTVFAVSSSPAYRKNLTPLNSNTLLKFCRTLLLAD